MAANAARLPLAKMAVEETGMGVVEDKVIKNHFASEYIYNRCGRSGLLIAVLCFSCHLAATSSVQLTSLRNASGLQCFRFCFMIATCCCHCCNPGTRTRRPAASSRLMRPAA